MTLLYVCRRSSLPRLLAGHVSPSQTVFGNSIDHDVHFVVAPKGNSTEFKYIDRIEQMLKTQERLLNIARKNQLSDDRLKIAKRQIDEETNFPINSYVLAEYETKKPDKASFSKHGPYQVVSKQGAVYTVRHLVTNHLYDYHAKILSEYHFDDLSPSPEQVARLDEAFRGIKEIVGHKFSNPRKFKSDLLLNILWDDEKVPIWTSWNKSLGEEETVHKYLNSNYMARFIPKRFTWSKDHPNYEQPEWFKRKRKREE